MNYTRSVENKPLSKVRSLVHMCANNSIMVLRSCVRNNVVRFVSALIMSSDKIGKSSRSLRIAIFCLCFDFK